MQALVPHMKAAGFGRIVNIISTSVKQPLPNLGVSNTIRGAVANWSKTLANELGGHGITVNNVLPGATNTQRLTEIASVKADMANQKLVSTLAGMDTANKIKLSNSDPYKKLEARIAGLDQQIKYQTNPDGTPKNPEKMGKLKTDLADLKTQQATLAANILGTGGGISTLPTNTPPPGVVREVKKP
jgi:NAD(P)-dependent dehydrogenase (short-subunit alcohol dehydrogenase family)